MNESNPIGARVPKGILKNSGRSSTSYSSGLSETNQEYGNPGAGYMNQDHYGHHHGIPPPQLQQQQQQQQQHTLQGYHHSAPLQVYSHEYGSMPTGQIPYSVPGPQDYIGGVGSTMSSQWDEYYSGMSAQHVQAPIDYVPTFRRKLERFITKKHNLLFQQLTAEEKPLLESRLVEKKSEGSYGVTPSLDEYLPLDSSERVKEFFRTVQTGDIVVGEVYSKSSSGLTFRLLCFDGGKRAYLEDLSIKGVCPPSQTIPLDSSDKAYEEDDKARLEILEINFDSRKLVLGMKGMKLSNEIRHAFPLGPVANEDLPREFIMTKIEAKSRRKRNYEQVLEDSSGFHNPNSTMCLGTSLGIFSNKKSLMLGLSGSYLKKDLASELRSAQNAKWAQHNVALGIRHFKQGNQVEAFQCLNKAMIIDPQNVEGLVARGALYANNGSFEKALEDFDAALKNAPDHFNGRKYMAETLIVFGKNKQEEGKLEEAFNSYSKCLATLPEHKEAILSLMSVHEQVDKVDTTRLSSTVVNKIVEVREKLRNMIAEEIAKKKLSYYDKIQGSASALGKKEKESSDSDSSSSDSSDSDSGSSSDGDRRDKKKKGKKRKKRSKKSKRSSKNSKSESLSPFSRKLAGSEMVGSAVSASSFTDWTQQIGINKMAGGSDVESQRSSKKSKKDKRSKKKKEKRKKKKRGSSSSSDSDTRDKSKKDKSKVITDFGEIEEQLTAFFSKCEQGKSDSRGGVHIPPQAVKVTVKQNVDRDYDRYNSSSRHIELIQDDLGRKASTRFSYNTDEGKSFLQSQNIVRTVQNDQTLRQKSTSSPDSSANDLDQSTKTPASKWRTIGSSDTAYSISTLGPVVAPKTIEKAVPPAPPARELPFAVSLDKLKPKDNDVRPERNYRSHSRQRSGSRDRRRSRSLSRSRSRSRSPFMHDRVRRNYSPGPRRRSFSRSRSRSGSRPRRRSRSGSPRRFRGGGRGRGRGFHGGRGGTRGNGKPFPPVVRISRFRNRFSRSKSRSDSKDRKASSRSPVRNKDAGRRSSSRHHSPNQQSKKKETGKRSGRLSDEDVRSKGSIPISSRKSVERKEKLHVLGLDTNKASDVEKLLEKHKAQKKEELREMNPDFFRLP